MKNIVPLISAIVAFCVVAGTVGASPAGPAHEGGDGTEHRTKPAVGGAPGTATQGSGKREPSPWPKWLYNEWRDRVSQTPTRYAELLSENAVRSRARQGAATRLAITLRSGPEGDDVILTLSKGRFNCVRSYCQLLARFDDGAILGYTGVAASSENANAVVLNEYASFVRHIRKSDSLMIRAELESEGTRDFSFDTVGLRWP